MSLLLAYITFLGILVCVDGNECVIAKCNCDHVTETIDCSRLTLHSVWYSSHTGKYIYTQLLLRHNQLTHFNISLLMVYLPKIEVIDLRDNTVLLCEDLAHQRAPSGLTIICNCQQAPLNTTLRTSTVQLTGQVSRNDRSSIKSTVINSPTSKHVALIVHKGNSSTAVLYIYCLMSAIFIFPIAIFIFQAITHYRQRRQNNRNLPPISLQQLSPLNEVDSDEENLIFVRETSSV